MKKLIRRITAVLLCVTALILAFIPSPDSYAATARGDYEMNGSVIVKYLGSSDRVTIPDNVTEIGKDAFSECKSLVRVVIPDTVSKIGYSAFENCTNLQEVVIPKSVKVIDSSAFSGCSKLTTVSIPEKTKSLGSGVFAGCSSLSNVPVSANNKYYSCSDGVIYTKNGKKLVQYLAGRPKTLFSMPKAVEEIGEYAFWGANNLTDVAISSNVKTIPEYAFANCGGLTNVALPYGVRSLMAYSFADCNSLRNISIPDSVSYIDVNAFAKSSSLSLAFDENVTPKPPELENEGQEGNSETVSGNALETTEEGETVYHGDETIAQRGPTTTAGPYPSNADYGETKILGGSALVMLSRNAPVKGYDLEAAQTEDDVSESGMPGESTGDYHLIEGVYSGYTGAGTEVTVPEGTVRIGNRAFYKDDELSVVMMPDTVTEIGDFAFAKTGLSRLAIPPSVTDIGYAAFYNSEKLTDIIIPDSVKNIELGALEGTGYLNNWYHDPSQGDFLIAGDGILLAYKGTGGSVNIPDGVRTVGAQCFYNDQSISEVTFPESLKKIGEEAFCGCTGLKELKLPDGLKHIEDRAFCGTSLKEVIVPSSVSTIGIGAFDNTGTSPVSDVVFLGNTLPEITHKPTAERLSASSLRTPSFNGTKTAIISDKAELSVKGSVTDPDRAGFRGSVFSITDYSKDPGTLILRASLNAPDKDGIVEIDPHVTAGGRAYVMTDVSDRAFDSYREELYYNGALRWAGSALKQIDIKGSGSEALTELLSGVYTGGTPVENTEQNAIKLLLSKDVFSDQAGSAVVPGSTENYVLSVSGDDTRRELFAENIKKEYNTDDISLVTLDISLSSMKGNIGIKRLGTGKLEICIPVPDSLRGETGIKAATLNDNLVYEPVAVSEVVVDNIPCIRFVASHLSPFAVFTIKERAGDMDGSVLHVGSTDGEATEVSQIQGTVSFAESAVYGVIGTLNKKAGEGLEIKWFVIVILLSLAMILFLIKDKKNRGGKHFER